MSQQEYVVPIAKSIACTKCHQLKSLKAKLANVFKQSGLSLIEFQKTYVCGACKHPSSANSAQELVCTKCHQPKRFKGRGVAQFEKSGLSFEDYKEQYVCGPCNAGVKPIKKLPKALTNPQGSEPAILDGTAEVNGESVVAPIPKKYKSIPLSSKPVQTIDLKDLKGSTVCWHQTIFLKNRTCDECGLYDYCGYHAKVLSKAEQKKRGVTTSTTSTQASESSLNGDEKDEKDSPAV